MYTVYWEHPSQGKLFVGEDQLMGASKQYRRLRYAFRFAHKLRQDPQTAHIDITYCGEYNVARWYDGDNPNTTFTFVNDHAVWLEDLPEWLPKYWLDKEVA